MNNRVREFGSSSWIKSTTIIPNKVRLGWLPSDSPVRMSTVWCMGMLGCRTWSLIFSSFQRPCDGATCGLCFNFFIMVQESRHDGRRRRHWNSRQRPCMQVDRRYICYLNDRENAEYGIVGLCVWLCSHVVVFERVVEFNVCCQSGDEEAFEEFGKSVIEVFVSVGCWVCLVLVVPFVNGCKRESCQAVGCVWDSHKPFKKMRTGA